MELFGIADFAAHGFFAALYEYDGLGVFKENIAGRVAVFMKFFLYFFVDFVVGVFAFPIAAMYAEVVHQDAVGADVFARFCRFYGDLCMKLILFGLGVLHHQHVKGHGECAFVSRTGTPDLVDLVVVVGDELFGHFIWLCMKV